MSEHLILDPIMTTAAANFLSGKRALLVEDQTLIALDAETLLRELGAESVTSFTTAESAIEWLDTAAPDFGVLDISLGGSSSSYPVADILFRRAMPFIFTTGHAEVAIPRDYASVQIVRKPYTKEALGSALRLSFGPLK